VLRSDMAAADVLAPEPAPAEVVPPLAPEPDVPAPAAVPNRGWWQRLTEGMRRTSSSLSDSVTGLFTKRKLDDATLEELEDALVQADLGVPTAMRITEAISAGRYNKEISPQEVKTILAGEVEKTLQPVAQPLIVDRSQKPFVILMIGVNGAGKTTTIGKLAQKFRQQGLKVMLAAGDTFRAAAAEQLELWAERAGTEIVRGQAGSDPGAVVFDAIEAARARGHDVVIVDTAGRLHTQQHLMDELRKVRKVIERLAPGAPHETLLTIDATTGQNGLRQALLFREAVDVTGIALTKLDGTAKGGIALAIAQELGVPVKLIGIGEALEDLRPFDPDDFAQAILEP
jgi:fused signal recognition particle receptor